MAPLNLLGMAAVAVPLYLVLVALYRLTLHPLARYPGPFLRKISGWPDGLAAKSGKRHMVQHQLHSQYGPIVRVAPSRLSFSSSQAFHDIHTKRKVNVTKSGFVGFTRAVTESHHLQQLPDDLEHSQRRKIMAHAFSDSSLKSAEQFMLTQIRNWTNALRQGSDTAVDGWSNTKELGHWANLLTLDIFGELCFGESFKAVDSGDHNIVHLVIDGGRMSHVFAYLPIVFLFIPIMRTQSLLKLMSRKLYKARWALRKQLNDLVSRRQQAEIEAEENHVEARKDFFHHVLQGRDDDGNMLPLKNYVAEAVLLIVAGTDTTSTAMSATLFYLNRNPDKLEKVRDEVRAAFTDVEDIHTGPQLSSLTYLRACFEEAMRMTPPVPSALTRRVLSGGATVEGIPIPAGIDLEVPLYTLLRNGDYFPDPFSYLPERWIVGSKTPHFEVTEDLVAKQRNAFVPFSTGTRNCLGMRMAYMEMGIVLARLIFLFDMRFDQDRQPPTKEFETLDFFISSKDGPYLQFKPRQAVKA